MNISDATIEELKAEIERRERGHSVRMIEFGGPDNDGDYGVRGGGLPVEVWAQKARRDGYAPDRLAREVALAPCMADFVRRAGNSGINNIVIGTPMWHEYIWLSNMIDGDNVHVDENDAARAAGWIA